MKMMKIFPKIKKISKDEWLKNKPLADKLACYHPFSNTIFVREDCFTYGVLLHELGHWMIHQLPVDDKWYQFLNIWWDDRCFFIHHLILVALRAKIISFEDLDSEEEVVEEEEEKMPSFDFSFYSEGT